MRILIVGDGKVGHTLATELLREGNDITIAFNNRYLIDSLRACQADRVKLSMSSPLSSINIEPSDEDTTDEDLFMLLPVRMKD